IIELNTKERESAIEELKAKYETDQLKQDKIIAQANETKAKEKEKQSKNLNYVAIGVILLIGLFLFYIYKQLKLIQQQKKELDVAYDQLELSKKHELAASNLKAIKSQMNPHFIFNSINSIQDLVLQQESLKSYDYLVVFSKLVRNILDYSEREFIPLEEEISFLNTYLGLEKLRFKDEFEFTISSTLLAKGTLIPSLIIQPFAENAIKHGLLHKKDKKQLQITFTEQENGIFCTVKDNGIGIEESKKIKARQGNAHKSFSTEAIQKRLSLLQEQTQSNSGYVMKTIFDDNGNVAGTEVLITLPIK
ncbi:MAG: histidine kinase, partial [Flavobacteriales bacterium]|nr:histidine kinase [Flavobacteriales bacterium]